MVFGSENLIMMNKLIFMDDITSQEKRWKGKFGNEYISRNLLTPKEMDRLYLQNYGITRTKLNEEFIGNFNRTFKILEIGSNVGIQLIYLQKMGFKQVYGIEINQKAVEFSKKITKNINIIQGTALDVPFKDNYFDLVFTSGILIHISPQDIEKVMREIYRCTNKYIWGFEYYADSYEEVVYRGKKNMLWKANFPKLYTDLFKDLKLVKEKKLKYLHNENIDVMFLLKKR